MVADIAKVGLGCMKQVMSSIVDWSVKVYTDEAIDTVESIIGPVIETLPEIVIPSKPGIRCKVQ